MFGSGVCTKIASSRAMSACMAATAPARSLTTTSSSLRKPGGLQRSLALAQERERGAWPACFDELWAAIADRYGASEAARQMVDLLMLAREHGPARLELAVRGALAAGAVDGRAVAVLARRAEQPARRTEPLADLDARLMAHDRPEPDLAGYDALIEGWS
jgi:hypothetical protein